MIRKLRKADINKVADIWLDTNIKAHYSIAEMKASETQAKSKICSILLAFLSI